MATLIRHSHAEDFAAWAAETADSIEQGRFEDLDLEALADEVRDLARSEQREVNAQLRRLLAHLLKWAYQPDKRGTSWQVSILDARERIEDALSGSPSLRPKLTPHVVNRLWQSARKRAMIETHLAPATFPLHCRWDLNTEILNADWLP